MDTQTENITFSTNKGRKKYLHTMQVEQDVTSSVYFDVIIFTNSERSKLLISHSKNKF